jgi:hypothetical protein
MHGQRPVGAGEFWLSLLWRSHCFWKNPSIHWSADDNNNAGLFYDHEVTVRDDDVHCVSGTGLTQRR